MDQQVAQQNDQYIHLKWSPSVNDQFYEKSKKEDKHKAIGNNVMETILQEGPTFINTEGINRVNGLEGFGELGNQSDNGRGGNKRESSFEKINERELVAQTNLNPFLSTNYLDDLKVQEDFLTPQNSNM